MQHVSDPRLHKKYGLEVRNFDIDVWEREREILYLSVLTPSSPKLQSCHTIVWTRATYFSWKLVLTTSYEASDTGRRPLCTPTAPTARLNFSGERSSNCAAYLPQSRTATGAPPTKSCLIRAPDPPVETASLGLSLLRDSNCVHTTRQQPPLRPAIPTLQ